MYAHRPVLLFPIIILSTANNHQPLVTNHWHHILVWQHLFTISMFGNLQLPSITYCTETGFGQATNCAVMWILRDLQYPTHNWDAYVLSALANVDRTPATLPISMTMLSLSDEILLRILGFIDCNYRNECLHALSLTCRQLQGIAQAILLVSGVIYPYGLRAYLEKLVHHPAKLLKMTKIECEDPEVVRYGLGGFYEKNRRYEWPTTILSLALKKTWDKVGQTPQLNSSIQAHSRTHTRVYV
jgi:hypothetical protein